MRCWHFWIGLFSFGAILVAEPATDKIRIPAADAFDQPVGKPDGVGYYMARGFLSYHPGEDWDGIRGGNTDLGDPVYAIGNGYVTYARDAQMGWGNVVLVRHVFLETYGAIIAVLETRTLADSIASAEMRASEGGQYDNDVFIGAVI